MVRPLWASQSSIQAMGKRATWCKPTSYDPTFTHRKQLPAERIEAYAENAGIVAIR
jgi:hypothetical protein